MVAWSSRLVIVFYYEVHEPPHFPVRAADDAALRILIPKGSTCPAGGGFSDRKLKDDESKLSSLTMYKRDAGQLKIGILPHNVWMRGKGT